MNQIINEHLTDDVEAFHLSINDALKQLEIFDKFTTAKCQQFIGYPCNTRLKLSEFFQWWVAANASHFPLNDVGNPYAESTYTLNARRFERTVLDYFAKLFAIDDPWGYVTSGGTQGNEQALYIGREVLAPHGIPILYVSTEAHYSIVSLARVLGLKTCVIASQKHGEMDYHDLFQKLDPSHPALFSLSIGTTFKGAIDQIEIVDRLVKMKGINHVYYHADAALFGGYLPFICDPEKPHLDFHLLPYDSIAISAHKFFGSPVPIGLFLTYNKHLQALKGEYIEYIDTQNFTIPCSRSSLNTLIFWWIISTIPVAQFADDINTMLTNATYLRKELVKRNYPAWINHHSNTVYFRAPSLQLCKRWTLATMTCPYLGQLAHIVVMQHVDRACIERFLQELAEDVV